jgi:hypothetical protein
VPKIRGHLEGKGKMMDGWMVVVKEKNTPAPKRETPPPLKIPLTFFKKNHNILI